MRKLLLLVSLALCGLCGLAQVKPPAFALCALFSDNMVLQRNAPVPVWGTAVPGAEVTVQCNGQQQKAKTDTAGKWMVRLSPMTAGGPYTLAATDGQANVELHNVMVGEVWLCSGQSNVELPVSKFANAEAWLADADYPTIRCATIPWNPTIDPDAPCVTDGWKVCNKENAANFSATGFLFARQLSKTLNVPVGIICSAISGSVIAPWMSREALMGFPDGRKMVADYDRWVMAYPNKLHEYLAEEERRKGLTPEEVKQLPPTEFPSVFPSFSGYYHGMIRPLMPYAIKGAVWYQGESNAMFAQGEPYRRFLSAMISEWRAHWGQGDFPFLIVQLPNYQQGTELWPELRDSQTVVASTLPNIGLAVTIDIGEAKNIHPNNKEELANRLVLQARKVAYGEKIVASGPTYTAMTVGADGKVTLTFDNIGGGLVARNDTPDAGTLAGFMIAGEDKRFVPASAQLQGDKVVVWNDRVAKPQAVRYAWQDCPTGLNLYNKEGLPAMPFRTDSWRLRTQPNNVE